MDYYKVYSTESLNITVYSTCTILIADVRIRVCLLPRLHTNYLTPLSRHPVPESMAQEGMGDEEAVDEFFSQILAAAMPQLPSTESAEAYKCFQKKLA